MGDPGLLAGVLAEPELTRGSVAELGARPPTQGCCCGPPPCSTRCRRPESAPRRSLQVAVDSDAVPDRGSSAPCGTALQEAGATGRREGERDAD